MLRSSKGAFALVVALCLMLFLTACGNQERKLEGYPAYDRLGTQEEQELYRELLNAIEAERYEVTIDVSDPKRLWTACKAIISDLSDSIVVPQEIKKLEERELMGGKTRMMLRIIYSEE